MRMLKRPLLKSPGFESVVHICHLTKHPPREASPLDSINDEFVLSDCGMTYVFACFNCLETKSILQSF
jgi:hypothetical protein